MEFRLIDPNTWKRKEYFEHYFAHVPCTYSTTVKLDITGLKNGQKKLYPSLLYGLATLVDQPKFHYVLLFCMSRPDVDGCFPFTILTDII